MGGPHPRSGVAGRVNVHVRVGGMYRAVPPFGDGPAALVLVTGADNGGRSAAVTLLSPDVQFGTSADILIPAGAGRPYVLLAQSDVFGWVWTTQLDRQVGSVPDTNLDVLSALRDNDQPAGVTAGPPVLTRDDPRWRFKADELVRLHAVTFACVRELVNNGA